MHIDVQMRALAERQHGVVARRQVIGLGADRHHLRRRLASPDWAAVTPVVLRLVGAQRTFRQRCMAAALDAGDGAVVSHESAAVLWRLPGFTQGPIHVTRPTGRSALATVHRSDVPDAHARRVENIPVTSGARTIFDLAGVLHPGRTERALDNALARGLTTIDALHLVTDDLARSGRAGSRLMCRLLAERDASYVPPESNLEARFSSIVRAAGLPMPQRQRNVGGADWAGRVDYVDPARKVIYEIDSDLHHSTMLDQASDARRDEALGDAGYTIVRLREYDVWHRPQEVVRRFLAS